jgi:hypothetical protein
MFQAEPCVTHDRQGRFMFKSKTRQPAGAARNADPDPAVAT